MNKEYLPVGTVVLLKNAKRELMIIGYNITSKGKEDEIIFDYLGCDALLGIKTKNRYKLFNRDQIDKIIRQGYKDKDWDEFKEKLEK